MKISNSRFVLADLDRRGQPEKVTTRETIFWRFALVLACMDAFIFVVLR